MDGLEGMCEGWEQSEQEYKLEQRDYMKRKLDLQEQPMQVARREARDRRRKDKGRCGSPGQKEIREEARERMKHNASLTYDEAVSEAKHERGSVNSDSESDV